MNARSLALVVALAIAACGGPRIAPSPPSSYLVVLAKADATALVIEPNSGHVRETFATGVGPHEVAVSRDGRYAVVADYGDKDHEGHTLTVYNLVERRPERVIDLVPHVRPHGIAFLDRRSTVLVTAEKSGAVLQVGVQNGDVERVIPTGGKLTHMIAVALDRTRAYTANIESGSISALDLEKGALIRTVDTGAEPEAIAVSPDGREVWVGHNKDNTVKVLDAATLETKHTISDLSVPIRVKIAPDGGIAVVSCAGSGEAVIVDAK